MDLRHALFLCLFLCKIIPCFFDFFFFLRCKITEPLFLSGLMTSTTRWLQLSGDFNYQMISIIR